MEAVEVPRLFPDVKSVLVERGKVGALNQGLPRLATRCNGAMRSPRQWWTDRAAGSAWKQSRRGCIVYATGSTITQAPERGVWQGLAISSRCDGLLRDGTGHSGSVVV